jgi:hypothetical protein
MRLDGSSFRVVRAIFSRLGPAAKVGVVMAGYVLAVAIAALVVRLYVAATSGVDRQLYAGMSAFGDSLVFLAALGVAAVPTTGAALYFLRSRRAFWVVLSAVSVIVACTAIVSVALLVGSTAVAARTALPSWSMLAPLRILVAPVLAVFSLLAAVFAQTRSSRLWLLGASATEIVSFAVVAVTWWGSR